MSGEPGRASLHDLRGALNGLSLQLEVMALAFERGDDALHDRALTAAREAVARLTDEVERLAPPTAGGKREAVAEASGDGSERHR